MPGSLSLSYLMIRPPPRSTLDRSSAASDVYKRQPHKVRCLAETHVAIVVAVNQKHRRLPTRDRRHRRRLPRHVKRLLNIRNLLVTILEQTRSALGGPIVYAVNVNSRSE